MKHPIYRKMMDRKPLVAGKPSSVCIGCGCSNRVPCIIDAETGETCRIVHADICSRCYEKAGREITTPITRRILKRYIKQKR